MSKLCRWGILGAASIARKNWKGIRRSGNGVVAAVASRDAARAQAFIDDCQGEVPFPVAPVVVGSYEELLARPDIDAVYVPLPTGVRKEWVIKAAEAGKHVLCEKPCAPTAAELREMLDACKHHRVQFMDGVMFMHSKRLPLLRAALDDGETVGSVRRIASHFSFAAPPEFFAGNIRASSALEPLGCLGDLGWYNVRFILWALNYARPLKVTAKRLDSVGPDRVPTEFSAELLFAAGASASFYCSFTTEIQQWAHVSGTKGSLRVDDFVLPFHGPEAGFTADRPRFMVSGCTFHMASHARRHAAAEFSDGEADSQETNMARRFAELALSGSPDTSWGEIALATQEVLEECVAAARDAAG